MNIKAVAEYLRSHDDYLILTHRGPDGDTLGCAAALCAMLRGLGKTAAILNNPEVTARYAPYVAPYWAAEDYSYKTVVSVDMAARSLFPDNAKYLWEKVDFAIDHHPSYEGFARESYVDATCASCGEILCYIAEELGQLTAEVALPLYLAVSTDTGCFVYANVTAETHRVAAKLMAVGIDYRSVNKNIFRTKSKKRMALEGRLLNSMEFFDEGRGVVLQIPLSLMEELELTEYDLDDIAALGGLVEGTDCAITMKEKSPNFWKVSVRTGYRVNATAVCTRLGGGGHRMAAGCALYGHSAEEAKEALIRAVLQSVAAGE